MGYASIALICLLVGCRSQAHQQVYSEKMAGEIRRLEDSLYALEYENEVLQQQLARATERNADRQDESDRENRMGAGGSDSRPGPRSGQRGIEDRGGTDKQRGTLDRLPPAKPLPNRQEDFTDPLGDGLDIDLGQPMDLGDGARPPSLDSGTPPPIAPIPPRASDIAPPAIDLGDPQPPGTNNGTKPKPEGQIELPGEVRKLFSEPTTYTATKVEIYPGLSGFYHLNNDSEADGLHLVLAVKIAEGVSFDPASPISIVLLDPSRAGEDARLGRWDFQAAEVARFFKETPVAGFHIPLDWKGKQPNSNEVAVFVRVRPSETEMIETDTMLQLGTGDDSSTTWIPNPFGAQLALPNFDRSSVWR